MALYPFFLSTISLLGIMLVPFYLLIVKHHTLIFSLQNYLFEVEREGHTETKRSSMSICFPKACDDWRWAWDSSLVLGTQSKSPT